jgi:thymidine kinase
MFSGKTEEVVRRLRRADIAGQTVLVFKPKSDTRSKSLRSRAGSRFPSKSFVDATDIARAAEKIDADLIAVEESQFADDGLLIVVEQMIRDGRDVLVSGLDLDFLARPFGMMPELLAMAEDVQKLTAVCMYTGCGDYATRTQRIVNGRPATPRDPLIVIGGIGDSGEPDRYEARCRRHHEIGR